MSAALSLAELAHATTIDKVDCISFQPSPLPTDASQDRYTALTLALPSGSWKLRTVLDGHMGHETVNFSSVKLNEHLVCKLEQLSTGFGDSDVKGALKAAIVELDDYLKQDLLRVIPDPAAVSEEQLKSLSEESKSVLLRAIRGTTVLIALISPQGRLYVASLGDCIAVLGTKDPEANEWASQILSFDHNGANPVEKERIEKEHPDEPTVLENGRVLGVIAVTRALGDFTFKLPPIWTTRVFQYTGFKPSMPSAMQKAISRNLTTPYLSNVPEVSALPLDMSKKNLLILASDGLLDLYSPRFQPTTTAVNRLARKWVEVASSTFGCNMALEVLKAGTNNVKKMISGPEGARNVGKWMDDTTILVELL